MPPSADTNARDVQLMRAFQSGDADAYDQLVRLHLPFVVRQARRYVRDTSSAEDVAQEVFLRLYRSGNLFREGTNFRGWLATITSRLALNELRTRRRKHWVARSTLEGDLTANEWRPGDSSSEEPSEALLRDERIAAVQTAIRALPERQRQALCLQRFEGWDLQQVGEALELSVPAVKSLLHRARASLMKELEVYFQETKSVSPGRNP